MTNRTMMPFSSASFSTAAPAHIFFKALPSQKIQIKSAIKEKKNPESSSCKIHNFFFFFFYKCNILKKLIDIEKDSHINTKNPYIHYKILICNLTKVIYF